MPRVLVDVRHEAAHNELPSLPVLRLAADHALAWLRHFYWERQADSLRDTLAQITSLVKVGSLLKRLEGRLAPSSAHCICSEIRSS